MKTAALDPALEAELLRPKSGADRERAFEAVFRALRGPLFALCLHVTHDRDEAEDALQETFLAVHRALPAFRGDAQLSTWIWRIAIRAALHVRAKRRPAEPLDAEPVAPATPNPALATEQHTRLRAGFAALSADHRVVLALFAIEGLSHKEIAELLGVPEGTIWSRLHVARKQLAAKIGG